LQFTFVFFNFVLQNQETRVNGCKITTTVKIVRLVCFKIVQTATIGPIADIGNQPCKVEANKGAGSQPCKVQEWVKLRVQDFNLAKLKQTIASNKQQTNEKAPRGPIIAAGPQFFKVESKNNKQHPTNQRVSINQ
jgi:hypothetical protein